jgi:hypothetical protein
VSEFVPFNMATMVPFFPLADLLETTVYNSPCESEVSSIDKFGPKFSSNTMPSLAEWRYFQLLKSLKRFLY